MKSVFKVAVTVAAILWILCLQGKVSAQQIKRVGPISKSVFVFRPIRLSGRSEKVTVEVRGHKVQNGFHPDEVDSLEIVLSTVRNGRRHILSKTHLDDDLFWFDASLYRHRSSGDYLLAIEENGGQHDHTLVYYIEPRHLHVRLVFDEMGVIYGDPSGLPKGHLIEHTPDQYVDEDEKPKGFKRRKQSTAEYLARTWTYQSRTHRFVASRYWWEK